MRKMKHLLPLLFLLHTALMADTMFTLSGIKKLYPVVEVSGKKIPKSEKDAVMELLQETTDELHINTSGYDPRSLAILISEIYVGKEVLIHVQLIIGEQVQRLDSGEKTFALTYGDKEYFRFDENYEEHLEDAVDTLLSRFSDQYREEHQQIEKVATSKQEFAEAMHYETNYEAALKRAKKEKKNIMLVLVSNYCPWCRKFEARVLVKKEVDDLVQKHFVPLIINKEKEPFPKRFDKGFTPIVHFINYKTEQRYEGIVGYNSKDEFLYILKKEDAKK